MAHIQIFECQAYMHVPNEKRSKLDPKLVKGFFVGLSENKKGYVIADSQNHLQLYKSHCHKLHLVISPPILPQFPWS